MIARARLVIGFQLPSIVPYGKKDGIRAFNEVVWAELLLN
jgi:hypothetical protein